MMEGVTLRSLYLISIISFTVDIYSDQDTEAAVALSEGLAETHFYLLSLSGVAYLNFQLPKIRRENLTERINKF